MLFYYYLRKGKKKREKATIMALNENKQNRCAHVSRNWSRDRLGIAQPCSQARPVTHGFLFFNSKDSPVFLLLLLINLGITPAANIFFFFFVQLNRPTGWRGVSGPWATSHSHDLVAEAVSQLWRPLFHRFR